MAQHLPLQKPGLYQNWWDQLARQNAFKAVLTSPDADSPDTFFATGVREIEAVRNRVSSLGLEFAGERALDFGCELGRLSRALARYYSFVVGVDLSRQMLARARALNPPANCAFVLSAAPDLRLLASDQFDLVYSSITLQHVQPRIALRYIAEFVRVSKPRALIIFQLTSHQTEPGWMRYIPQNLFRHVAFAWACRRYPGALLFPMYGIRPRRVVAVLHEHGAQLLLLEPTDSAGPAWVSYRYYAMKRWPRPAR